MPTTKDNKKTKKNKKTTHHKLNIKFEKKQMSLADFIRKYSNELQYMIQTGGIPGGVRVADPAVEVKGA